MFVVIDVTNDDSECIGAADWWIPTVPDDHRNVIFFTLFSVECLQACDYTGPVTVVTTSCNIHCESKKTCHHTFVHIFAKY